jgi:hypothetical protein
VPIILVSVVWFFYDYAITVMDLLHGLTVVFAPKDQIKNSLGFLEVGEDKKLRIGIVVEAILLF